MKELVFALQIKGKARPVEGVEAKLAAKTAAAGQEHLGRADHLVAA